MNDDLSSISAEVLLNYLYPEQEERWTAPHKGTFYRNYNRDVLELDTEAAVVVLSRDGFTKLLPERLLFDEEELRGKDVKEQYKVIEERTRLLRDAFLPLDTFAFRQRLKIEREVSAMLAEKFRFLMQFYFGIDLETEENPYVRRLATLLPFVSRRRGDFYYLAKILGDLVGCKTRLKTGRYSDSDSTQCWVPSVEFQLLVPDLSADAYRQLYNQVQPLEQFVTEWFIPAEVRCRITVKHHNQSQQTGNALTLDYNTEI